MKSWKIAAALLGAVVLGVGWDVWQASENLSPAGSIGVPQPPVASAGAEPSSSLNTSAEKEVPSFAPIPPANISDGAVIVAANDLAPQLVQWLTPSEQVRKWVALVDQIAAGKLPRNVLPLDYPMTPFRVKHYHWRLMFDNDNYRRANWLIDVVTQISAASLARAYEAWLPQLNTAFRDLGGKGGFDKRLREAIHRVLVVQPLNSPPDLTRLGDYYQYADPKLEQADDVEKLLWRLGPNNTERLQSYLRELEPLLIAPTIDAKLPPAGH